MFKYVLVKTARTITKTKYSFRNIQSLFSFWIKSTTFYVY